ncbi:AsmA family protein [Sphingomonas sp. Leaf407]|uniref:AsmA family protein n=1 Tax=unclassified Sphingomonas TaxID=196159 RepID=UPI0006F37A59|nr:MULTISPECIES: AsmA family protein [unclassified Sphingomonas]KQN35617.1 AsmA family protein [Sphingomonas sp. Leaf42]KQT26484.1 AsmA family protein [Sphingomonas sp. Leaf407]
MAEVPQTIGSADMPRPRRDWRRIVVRVLLGIVAAVFLAWLVLFITKGRFLKGTFERIASAQSGRTIRVAGDFQFYFAPIDLKFLAEGLSVSNPAWAGGGNTFEARKLDSSVATLTFLFGRRRVNWLELDGARADLHWDARRQRNTWTFGDPNAKGKKLELPVVRAGTFRDTRIRYRDPQFVLDGNFLLDTVTSSDTRFDSAIRARGQGMVRGRPFRLTGQLQSPNATIRGGENQLTARIEVARSVAILAGTLPGPTQLDGSNLAVRLRGRNLADVFAVLGIVTPDTRTYRLTGRMTKDGPDWKFTRLRGVFGDSDLAGSLTVTQREPRLLLTADLTTRTLDIVDVSAFVGYDLERVEAQGAAGVITREGGAPRLLPDARLNVEALKNFDAKVRYKVGTLRARSLPISNADLTLDLEDRLLKLSPLTFAMARGNVASDIVIDARKRPSVTDYDIRLSPTPMGRLLAGWGVEEAGTTGTVKARVKLTGVGDTVHDSLATSNGRIAVILPAGSFWTRNVQLSELDLGTFAQKMFEGRLKEPVRINCGLIGFTVRAGVAAADPILIDTQKNVMIGRGGFSFRNETIDLAFRADSKRFSLLAGQSPVGIGGYFASPSYSVVSPELLGRAGAALGLAVVATPLAGVLAFVDPGDAKATACGPVLAGATARAQRTTGGEARDDVGRGTTAKAENGRSNRGERKEQRKKFLGIF